MFCFRGGHRKRNGRAKLCQPCCNLHACHREKYQAPQRSPKIEPLKNTGIRHLQFKPIPWPSYNVTGLRSELLYKNKGRSSSANRLTTLTAELRDFLNSLQTIGNPVTGAQSCPHMLKIKIRTPDPDIALWKFETSKYYVTIIDAPGHRDFIKT